MFALALALLALAADPKDPVKEAQDALQGEWRMVEFAAEGEANNRAGFVSIKSDQLVITMRRRAETSTFKLDPKATPATMDIAPKGDLAIKAIYKLEKDKLTICFGPDGTDRPKEFKSAKDVVLVVLERVPAVTAAEKELLAALAGEWKATKFVLGGNPTDEANLPTVTIKGDQLVLTKGKRTYTQTIRLDPKASPVTLDMNLEREGPTYAIIKLDKDTLTICMGMEEGPRPKDFTSTEKSARALLVLVREKKK